MHEPDRLGFAAATRPGHARDREQRRRQRECSSAPAAIARATSRLTAPCSLINAMGTPMSSFGLLEYVTNPARPQSDEPAISVNTGTQNRGTAFSRAIISLRARSVERSESAVAIKAGGNLVHPLAEGALRAMTRS